MARSRDQSFWEWQQDQHRLGKAPASGGVQSPVNPGYGMSGSPGNTASYAPTGPAYRRSGNQGLPAPDYQPGLSPNSKYTFDAPSQPQPWIDDVDMGASWWCYDDQTEILTSHRGWQLFADLTDEDNVATLCPVTKSFQWQRPAQRPVFDYVGPLINFESRSVDLMVTPQHRMLTDKLTHKMARFLGIPARKESGTFFVPAEAMEYGLNHHVGIPVTCDAWEAHDLPDFKYTVHQEAYCLTGEGYAGFLGLYLSEGSVSKVDGAPKSIKIWQDRRSSRLAEMRDMLEAAFQDNVHYIDHLGSNGRVGYFVINSSDLASHVSKFGTESNNKFIPLGMKNASRFNLRKFLKGYVLGDGSYKEDQAITGEKSGQFRLAPKEINARIVTSSAQMADDLQEIIVKLGYSCSVEKKRTSAGRMIGDRVINHTADTYRVSIRGAKIISGLRTHRISYAGKVYCVSVPNQTVYVRRNNKACWSGNSPFQPVWPYGPPWVSQPREWNYPVGYNLNYIPQRMQLMAMLRGMRASWGVLATIIATRQDQLLRIPWTIQRKDKPRASSVAVDEMKKFFKRPDGKLSYSQWTRKLTDDLLVLDAPSIYFARDRRGRPLHAEVLDGACYSADTEVLTRRGWFRFDETFKDDEFATRHPVTKAFEWQRSHYFHCQDWTGRKMIQFKSRTLDLLVTPTHRMLVQVKSSMYSGYNSPEQILLAQDIESSIGNWCIPQTSIWDAKPIREVVFRPTNVRGAAYEDTPRGRLPINGNFGVAKSCENCGDSFIVHRYRAASARFCSDRCRRQGLAKTVKMSGDDFCAFMGMWLSEGCIVDNDRILISQQRKSKGFLEFQRLLTRIDGGKEPYYNEGNGYWDMHARCVYTYLEQFGHATEKFVPELIKNASRAQLEIFWHYYMLGDGCFEGKRQHIATASYRIAGDLQEIAQKLGLSAGIYAKKEASVAAQINGREIISTTTQYTVRLRQSTHIGVESAEYVDGYEGNVYCVSVPNEALYVRRNGRPTWCLNTIFPLIDDAGRRPDSAVELTADGMQYLRRQPAFQQIIYGLPMIDMDESELMYVPMRPRADLPMFGYPGTEQILVEASEAVTKTFYQLNFWREGTIPDLIVTVPKEWSPRQIAMYQAHFDALLSGNINLKSKVRFLPGDSKPFDIKNSSGESLWSQRDETLVRLACYAYSVSPAPFIKMLNRSTAQNAQQMAEEEGLWPLMSYWKDDIIDPIIERFGYDDIEFTFLPKPEPDQEKAAKIHDMKIKNGEYSINEARGEDGLEPVPGGDIHLIYIGNAVVPLADAVAGNAMPMQGGEPGAKPAAGPSGAPKPTAKPTNAPLRGPARTSSTGEASSTQKSATPAELEAAVGNAEGGLNEFSHLVLHQGNYPKGHIWIQGLNVSIENAPGSTRGEKDQHGVKWQVKMPAAYGYIRGTIGADGDQIDCYLGDNPKSKVVWVIDQNRVSKKGKMKGFDEHKVLLCYDSLEAGLRDYLLSHFDGHGHDQICAITELAMKEFKAWLAGGELKKPIADQHVGEIVLKAKDLKKLDTISSATGLNYYSQFAARPSKKRKSKKQGPRWLQLRAKSPSPIV